MIIRTFRPGDEAAQVSIYNEAAADLPGFKPATLDELRRRCHGPDFDPETRFFALDDAGQPVGYATFHANGRVSFPWCRPGHEAAAEPLFEKVLEAMRGRGLRRAFAAYRADWPQGEFFTARGFRLAREMVNFVVDLVDMPTAAARGGSYISPMQREDVPAIFALAPKALRVGTPEELERHLFHNPYFGPDALFVLRTRRDGPPVAAGVLIENPAYADPKKVDAAMPCFRLGAFGTEGMQVKRINGLFSFLTEPGRDTSPLALDLMGHAALRLHHTECECLAAQVPSDVPHLLRFYQQYFRRQGSFPVYEYDLSSAPSPPTPLPQTGERGGK
ncbi:MAG TPA: hypothetical protein VNK04_06885 [Gemmataceae bacterium]|nr:hypothetical protein [Gemmataceae bacterium]